jgi:DNA replication and repair protein RecF
MKMIERELEAVIHPKGKTLLVRKQPLKRSSEFIGLLNVVLFAPDDLSLFTDAPKRKKKNHESGDYKDLQ